jgi:hypothetical protein
MLRGFFLLSGEHPEFHHCASTPLAWVASMVMQDVIPVEGFVSGGAEKVLCRKWVDKMQSNDYWSGTEYSSNPNNAWNFNFNNGNQNNDNKDNNNYAWAVRPG